MTEKTSRVNPDIIVWAREQSGRSTDDVAKKLNIPADRYELIEAGHDHLTFAQLRKLADLLRRPQAIFYLPARPAAEDTPPDFRSFAVAPTPLTPEALSALRDANAIQRVARQLGDGGQDYDWSWVGSMRRMQEPVAAGARIRELAGITDAMQVGWNGDEYAALRAWRRAMDRLGVVVYQFAGVDTGELGGFCLATPPFPVIAVNRKDRPTRRSFSILHELAHLLLGSSALSNDVIASRPTYHGERAVRTEQFCNTAAAAAVMPAALFQAVLRKLKISKDPSDDAVKAVARHFCTSLSATLMRIAEFDLASPAYVRKKLADWSKAAHPRGEPREKPFEKAVRVNGAMFVSMVLDAVHRNKISHRDLADYLGMKTKWQRQLEDYLQRAGG